MGRQSCLRFSALFLLLLSPLADPATHGQDIPRTDAAAVGFSTQGLDRVKAVFRDAVDRKHIAGAVVLVLKDGKAVMFEPIGQRDVENNLPMTRDTLFRIASMTKAITSVAAMTLVEQGRLGLDDPLAKHLPEFKEMRVLAKGAKPDDLDPPTVAAERAITVRDLLRHTSGIVYGFAAPPPLAAMYASAGITDGLTQTDLTLAENVRRIAKMPLAHQPGAAFTYGLNTDVLGRVVEVASGEKLDQYLQKHIFEPLKMDDTAFYLSPDQRKRLAALYTLRSGSDHTIVRVGEEPVHAGNLTYSASAVYSGPRTYLSGGAGLVSSARDYGRFLQMLCNGGELEGTRILRAETVREMTTNQIDRLPGDFNVHGDRFGLGFGLVTKEGHGSASVGSFSWGGIYYTFFWVDPERKLVGIMMTQVYPSNELRLREEFQQRLYQAMTSADRKAADLGSRPERVAATP